MGAHCLSHTSANVCSAGHSWPRRLADWISCAVAADGGGGGASGGAARWTGRASATAFRGDGSEAHGLLCGVVACLSLANGNVRANPKTKIHHPKTTTINNKNVTTKTDRQTYGPVAACAWESSCKVLPPIRTSVAPQTHQRSAASWVPATSSTYVTPSCQP